MLTLRGIALSREGQIISAQDSFDRALRSCPASLPALEGAAQIAYSNHSPAAAGLLQRILLLQPDDQTSHAMLGSLSFQHGDCAGAIEHFERSLPLVEKSVEAQRELGSCLFSQGEQQKAVEVFQRIAQQDPSEKNLLQLAFVEWKSKDLDGALSTLQPLLTSNSDSKAFSLAAQVAEAKGRHAARGRMAAHCALAGPEQCGQLSAVRCDLVQSCLVPGWYRCCGLRASDESPDAAKLYLTRGVLQVQLSHYGEGRRRFRKAHALDPKLSFVEDAMGMIRSQQHDWAGSMAIFQQQAVEHPQDPLLQYLYAEASGA